MKQEYWVLLITVVVVGVVFSVLWRKGYLAEIAKYVHETREELKKCTWPNWEELRGSTVLVLVAIVLLGSFTVLSDLIVASIVHWII